MLKRFTAAVLLVAMLGGCENLTRQQQRALSGGAIGAAGGAIAGAIVGGPVLGLALLGGAAGAATGALTTPSHVNLGKPTQR